MLRCCLLLLLSWLGFSTQQAAAQRAGRGAAQNSQSAAQDSQRARPGTPAHPPAPRWKVAHEGEVSTLARHYFEPYGSYRRQAEGLTTQRLVAIRGARWRLVAEGRGTFNVRHDRRQRVWLNEAYALFRAGRWSVKAGKQVVKWGSLSGWSALDLANRYDYYDFLDTEDEALGLWGGEVRYRYDQTEIKVLFFPDEGRSRLHLTDNRWVDLPAATPHPAAPGQTIPLRRVSTQDTQTVRVPQVGLRISNSVGRFTTRLSAFYGQNDIPQPGVLIRSLDAEAATYQLSLRYHPTAIGALNVSTYAGYWNLWGEAAAVASQRADGERPALTDDNYGFVSVGADRRWTFANPERELRLLAQYVHSFTDPDVAYAPTEIDHVLQSALIVDLSFRLNYQWQAALRSVAEWATEGYYLRPAVTFLPTARWRLSLSADVLGGDPAGFFGYYQRNTRLAMRATFFLKS